MARDRNPGAVPRGDITLHPTDRDRARLAKLRRRVDLTASDILRRALVHLLATIERGEPVHLEVPSEQAEPPQP